MAYTKQNFQDGQILYASGLNKMDDELIALEKDKVNNDDIINNLTSTDATKPLSAAQGKVLNDGKVNKTDIINNLTSTNTDKPLSAAQGKILNENFNTSNTEIRNDISELKSDLDELKNVGASVDGIIRVDFELGSISINTGDNGSFNYTDSNKRIRTKKGVTYHLDEGDIISLSDYTNAVLSVGWVSNGVYYRQWEFKTDFIVSRAGEYVIILQYADERVVTDVSELSHLLTVNKKEYLKKELEDVKESIELTNKKIKEYPTFKFIEDINLICNAKILNNIDELLTYDGVAILKSYRNKGDGLFESNVQYNLLKVPCKESDILRVKLAPYWLHSSVITSMLILTFVNSKNIHTSFFVNFSGDNINVDDIKENGIVVPQDTVYALINIYDSYYYNNGNMYSTNGLTADVVTLNQSKEYTDYDLTSLEPLKDYVSNGGYFTSDDMIIISRYEQIIGDINTVLSSIVGGDE